MEPKKQCYFEVDTIHPKSEQIGGDCLSANKIGGKSAYIGTKIHDKSTLIATKRTERHFCSEVLMIFAFTALIFAENEKNWRSLDSKDSSFLDVWLILQA